MSNTKQKASPMTLARTAGFWYLLMAVVAPFGMIYVPQTLQVAGDAAATVQNIIDNEGLFRAGIVATLGTQIIQIFTVLALYKLLAPVNKWHAMLMSLFVLLAVPLAMLNELNHFAVLQLIGDNAHLTMFTQDEIQEIVPMLLDMQEHGVMIAHIFWGMWLFPMGYLVYKSGFAPKIIGILLMIGCFGYVADFLIFTLMPGTDILVSQYTFIGELLLPLWLIFKGVNVEKWEEHFHQMA